MPMELPRQSSHNSLSGMEAVPVRSMNKRGQVAGSAAQSIAQGVGVLLGFYSAISLLIPLAGSCLTCWAWVHGAGRHGARCAARWWKGVSEHGCRRISPSRPHASDAGYLTTSKNY